VSRKAKPKTKITTYTKTTLEVPIADVLTMLRKQHKSIPASVQVDIAPDSNDSLMRGALVLSWDSTETE
jgi:hypothetical protein